MTVPDSYNGSNNSINQHLYGGNESRSPFPNPDIQNNKHAFMQLIEKARNNIHENEYLRNEHLLFALLINDDNINSMKHLLNKNRRELYGLHLAPLRNKNHSIDSRGLFGKILDEKDQQKILVDLIKFLIRHRMYNYMCQYEMLRLYYSNLFTVI